VTGVPSARARGLIAVAVATVGFAVPLMLRDRLDPWRALAAVAVAAIGLSLWALGPRARRLFAIDARGVVVALALGVVLVVVTHGAFQLAARVSPSFAASVRELYASVEVGASPLVLLGLTIIVVIGEELVWRGVVVDLVGTGRSRAVVGATSVIAYVLPQLAAATPVLVVAAAMLGTVFVAQRLRTGRVIDPLLSHGVWSGSLFIVVPLA
jgi:membrane protease YdiL (CAAX protease family)